MVLQNIVIFIFILMLKFRSSIQTTFDVTTFGAVGDGKSDDTSAFAKAWNSVCHDKGPNSIMVVPANKVFLVKPMEFRGPCSSSPITVQVFGQIIAPKKNEFKSMTTWIAFLAINGLVIGGTGGFSGSATFNDWWKHGVGENRPAAFRLDGCVNVNINNLTFTQPPKNHISITSSKIVTITNIKIVAPETSPNTDGIDISNSNTVNIQHSNIQTGDDCVAINGGSFNINITDVNCGPGHGISVGSLGRNPAVLDSVNNIHVKNCTFTGTTNGARIKTFNGGRGSATTIRYEDILLNGVKNPIIIDQNYCVAGGCGGEASKVKVSDISFIGFTGTTLSKIAINLNCSASIPCVDITLSGIKIVSSSGNPTSSSCFSAYGTSNALNVPPVDCLKSH